MINVGKRLQRRWISPVQIVKRLREAIAQCELGLLNVVFGAIGAQFPSVQKPREKQE
jgi:hypothetical protein